MAQKGSENLSQDRPSAQLTSFSSKPNAPQVFDDFPAVGPADVAIFWDYENVKIPAWCPATTASESIRNRVAKYGRIVEKRLYYDSRQPTESMAPRSDLDLSGFTLVDCPSRRRKETLDKKLIVDVLFFAWERASLGTKACVVLITSDGDYSYALARLRDIGVFTVIIYKPDNVARVLIDNANVVMSWEFDVLGGVPHSQDDESVLGVETTQNVENESFDSPAQDDGDIIISANTSVTLIPTTELDATAEIKKTLKISPVSEEFCGKPNEAKSSKQPTAQTRSKFALFCSIVLNAQHRNVQEGISIYSSWADEGNVASTFYTKVGGKDRKSFLDIRSLATQKGFIEGGRRNLLAPGKPVIKVKDREDRADGLSSESYLRLTYSGLSVVNPNMDTPENDWKMVLPPKPSNPKERLPEATTKESLSTAANSGFKLARLFVGGLAWQTTEDSLRSYFKQFGPLKTVVVMEGRGYGFVFFQAVADAKRCLEKDKQHCVDNKSIE